MTVNTVFNPGEQVFFMEDNKIHSDYIVFSRVSLQVMAKPQVDHFLHSHTSKPYTECVLFASKELVRQSL